MAIVDKPWSGDAARWPDAKSYCKSCLIDKTKSGEEPTKDSCKLPIYEPNGDLNKNALGAAAAALAGARNELTGVTPADKKKAAKALLSAYREAQMPPPPSLKSMGS